MASGDDLHVVMVEPEIPWNTGNAGRSCLAAGARLHLVRPLGFQLDAPRVLRAGLDYWPRVAPRVWGGIDELERALPELGAAWFFSAEAPRDYWDSSYLGPVVLLFGCESVGLPEELRRRHADRLVRIPVAEGSVRSLNLSTSVAVALYEALRQRHRASGRQPAP